MENEQRTGMSMSEKAERKTSGKKRTRKDGEGTWNRKIKEEERRRRSADDDNGSGQGAVERGGRRERRNIASSEYGRGIRGLERGARRGYLTVPPREAVEVLIRNAGDHLHGTRSSTPSPPNPSPPSFPRFYLLPNSPLTLLFLLVSRFHYFVFPFLSSRLSPLFAPFPLYSFNLTVFLIIPICYIYFYIY